MEFLFNDLSVHGQFSDISSFCTAMSTLMEMRGIAQKFGHEVRCDKCLNHAKVTKHENMLQAAQRLERDQRSVLLHWIGKQGPYWTDGRTHGPDDYFECNDILVTDHAIGEAAHRCLSENTCWLLSIIPSHYGYSPLVVFLRSNDIADKSIEVINYFEPQTLEDDLHSMPPSIENWKELEEVSRTRFSHLTFAPDTFVPLQKQPFNSAASNTVSARLRVLNDMKDSFDATSKRTDNGNELYQKHFTGSGAYFSDSSDQEKNAFRSEMTFKHPTNKNKTISCPWHGKVRQQQLRIHFSWPITADNPLYVVYVGPKITKK